MSALGEAADYSPGLAMYMALEIGQRFFAVLFALLLLEYKNGQRLVKGPFCGAVKFNYPQGEDQITMSASAFASAPEIVRMNEWFGSGGSAGRSVLVSQRVKDIIDRMKWRGVTFSPIKITNE